MSFESYKPSPEEIAKAESMMTDEQRAMSEQRRKQLATAEAQQNSAEEESAGVERESVERWMKLGRENLESIPMPESLKSLIRESLETPQLGPYHNEGPEMAAHLGLIMENVDTINSDKFDFRTLGLPQDLEEKVKERITRAIKANYEQMRTYAYLHDLEKPSCMNIEDAGGKQRVFTMEEWRELVAQNGGDKEKAMVVLTGQGYTKIGYRIGGELAKELGIEDKDHGDEGEKMLLDMAAKDEEMKKFIDDLELILKGIANHELHFQVFNNAKSAGKFEKFLASNFSEDEIDFIYAACLIDIAGSLDKNGQSDFQGFRNMVVARENHGLIKSSGLKNVESLVNLDSVEKVKSRIEQLKKEAAAKEIKLEDADVVSLTEQAKTWGITSEDDMNELQKALSEAVGKENPASIVGQTLPNKLKRYIKNIKGYLETKVVR